MHVYNWYAKHHIPISEIVGGVIRTNKVPFMQSRKKLSSAAGCCYKLSNIKKQSSTFLQNINIISQRL